MKHPSNDDLERYCLGRLTDQAELAAIEQHLLVCAECISRAQETQDYIDAIRAAAQDLEP
jgi:hypothetical protein